MPCNSQNPSSSRVREGVATTTTSAILRKEIEQAQVEAVKQAYRDGLPLDSPEIRKRVIEATEKEKAKWRR